MRPFSLPTRRKHLVNEPHSGVPRRLRSAFATVAVGALILSGFSVLAPAMNIVSAPPAAADGAGQPFSCTVPTFFAQTGPDGNSTRLNAGSYVAGKSQWTALGAATGSSSTTYNALAFNPIDSYLYATRQNGTIVRIDSAGGQTEAAGAPNIGAASVLWDSGTFDSAGKYYVATGYSGTTTIKIVSGLGSGGAVTQSSLTIQSAKFADLSFKDGYLWGANYGTSGGAVIHRINPSTGAVISFAMPTGMPAANYGASFTMSNGNLAFISPDTMYQVSLAGPTTSTPVATLVNTVAAPANSRADGAICIANPANLSIAKTGPSIVSPGAAISWNLKITNAGPGASTGFTVRDQVPASVTGVSVALAEASTVHSCSATGNAVTCSGGLLMPDSSINITVSGVAPSTPGSVLNTATISGNEANPTGTTTSTPPATTVGDATTVTAVDDAVGSVALGGTANTVVRSNDSTTTGFSLAAPTIVTQPAAGQGVATVQSDGSITFTAPASGFSGTTSYQYNVCNNAVPTACATASVSAVVNNAFTDGADAAGITTPQNVSITSSLASIATTTGAGLDPLKVTQASAPTNGKLSIDSDSGAVTYIPSSGFTGSDSYGVTVCDVSVPSQCTTVTIPVTVGANVVSAVADAASTTVGSSVAVTVLSNDSVPAGGAALDATSVAITADPSNGSAVVNATTGVVTYTPDAQFSGADTFTYEVCDTSTPTPICGSAMVTVTVNNVFADGADAAGITTPQNVSITSSLASIATTTGAGLDPLKVTQASAPTNGKLSIDSDSGAVTYIPSSGFTGSDSYGVTVCDVSVPSQCTTVTIPVTVGANVVSAVADAASTTVATAVTVGVVGNDTVSSTGAPLDAGSVELTVAAANGSTVVNSTTGAVTYTPVAGFSGVDTFTYEVCDTSTPTPICDEAVVTITVNNVFAPSGGAGSTPQNTAVTTPLSAIVSTTGAAIDPTEVTQNTAPLHGTIVIDPATGAVQYTPDSGYTGSDSYVISVCDLSTPAQCSLVTVSVTVGANAVDARADSGTTAAVTPKVIPVLSNDTIAAGGASLDKSSVTIVVGASNGTTSVNTTTGDVTYAPAAGFSGTDTFTYRVCDTSNPVAVCDTAVVTVTVENGFVAGPAEAGISTLQNTDVTTPLASIVTATGSPVDPTSAVELASPMHGSIKVDPISGAVKYTPAPNYSGPDSYSIRVCDTAATPECTTAVVSVVVGSNAVVAVADSDSTDAGKPVTTDVLSQDSVIGAGAALNPASVTVTAAPAHGATQVNPATGEITYTPALGFSGTDSYTYRVCDTSAPTPVCGSAVVTISVKNSFIAGPGHDGEKPGTIATAQNAPIAVPLSEIVTTTGAPIAPATLAVSPGEGPTHGSVAIDPLTGQMTFTPTPGFSGSDSFGVSFCDSGLPATCSTARVTVQVAANVITAGPDSLKVGLGDSVVISPLGNDTSLSGQPLDPTSVIIASQPKHGTVAVDPISGDITYTADEGWMGTDTFTYTVCDTSFPEPACATTTVSVSTLPAVLAYTGGAVLLGLQLALAALMAGIGLLFIKRRALTREAARRAQGE